MRILLINNHHQIIGGTERYYFELADLLKQNGHKVAFMSTLNKNNKETKWSKYFVKKINFKNRSILNAFNIFPQMIYSFEAKRNISKLLDDFKPDIVHLQNIYYYISPSIIREITKRGIPIVQTVHDYQLINPNLTMFHRGKICEITKGNKYYKAIFHRCVKDSFIASLMSVAALYVQNINHHYERSINLFITPSIFMKNKLIEYGIEPNKIRQLNNFVDVSKKNQTRSKIGKYVFYFGRICEAKGIFILLDAAKKLPRIQFKIAGNFEDRKVESKILAKIKNEKIRNVNFLGYKNDHQIRKLITESQFVIVPSVWYENQPYSILETFAVGKTVIASKIGGVPEIVHNGKNGILYGARNVDELAQKIDKLLTNEVLIKKLELKAQETIYKKHNPEVCYQKIMKIYISLQKV